MCAFKLPLYSTGRWLMGQLCKLQPVANFMRVCHSGISVVRGWISSLIALPHVGVRGGWGTWVMKQNKHNMDSSNQPKKRKSTTDTNVDSDTDTSFSRFIVIESAETKPLSTLSPFIIEKQLNALIGTPKSVKKLGSGGLLVEVNRKKQAENLLRCNTFFNIKVLCTLHKTLNTSKGIIRCVELAGVPESEITDELGDQKVSNVKRIVITREGKRIQTNILIVTFNTPILPSSLKVGYLNVRVDTFIPNPLQCYNCFRFGHHERTCTSQSICKCCGTTHDDMQNCSNPTKCHNCKETHSATSRSCSKWVMEKEVLRVKYTQSLSFPEARKIVTNKSVPQHQVTYANATKQKVEVKDCAVQVNLCACNSKSIAVQTSDVAASKPKAKATSASSMPPKSTTQERRTQVSSSPERVIQRKSPKEKIVLTDRVKKGQRNPVLSPNRYEALSEESDVMSMEDEDLGIVPPSKHKSPIKYPK